MLSGSVLLLYGGKLIGLRIIGDIHGERAIYLKAVQNVPYSLQLGDLDDDYSHLRGLDPACHRFLPGNYDNYDVVHLALHSLGDFGTWEVPDFGPVFFMRGAWSMDWRARVSHDVLRCGIVIRKKDFWEQEELSVALCHKAYDAYGEAAPKFVVSHTCPDSVFSYVNTVGPPQTRTGTTLEAMLQQHRPKVWVFGHHHAAFDQVIDGTRFICVNACRFMDLPQNFAKDL